MGDKSRRYFKSLEKHIEREIQRYCSNNSVKIVFESKETPVKGQVERMALECRVQI
jgi:hypothetical protein